MINQILTPDGSMQSPDIQDADFNTRIKAKVLSLRAMAQRMQDMRRQLLSEAAEIEKIIGIDVVEIGKSDNITTL